ncbi:MAG: type I DNA topoisomerase [Actinobacteria bacterium]|uniref:DNA topoisomerase n=1 Tax=freshwater metagenome TaxID=449393 RepID=A0A6J6C431_9ZZZZ|nr:type I DNA topoisomerase [Actinomycetota bacterium]
MGKKLVIVESPAKAKTIAKYLGDDFSVMASVGHIRDLAEAKEIPTEQKKASPSLAKFSIDIENDFTPFYVISAGKNKTVTELKQALKTCDELYLATDEDREGEAIAWHLLQVLKPKVPVKRMVFNEITAKAISEAKENTRDLDDNLIQAQETRRVLDRLVGYEISPVLWRKINRGLSAGRVQSPAMRLIVERERERMAFVAANYASVVASCEFDSVVFDAKLLSIDAKRLAVSKSFDEKGKLTADVVVLDTEAAEKIAAEVNGKTLKVVSVESKPNSRKPYAPFTTSTLQQEASRKLGLSAKMTMDIAQQLYQAGHITYMRTDSPNLSQQAIEAARKQAGEMFGKDLVADAPRDYAAKSKNAQEAHEAIRPAGDVFQTPAELESVLLGKSHALYDLIWRRTLASQMADAKLSTTTAKLELKSATGLLEFTASGTVVNYKGFMAVYDETKEEEDEDSGKLPSLSEGASVDIKESTAKSHQTQPPARYTEASLVKALEEKGIGRPSTYASIISTIIGKGYVIKQGSALVPEWIAFTITRFLEENFDHLVDYEFTAKMEEDLDRIAMGELDRSKWLKDFYFGDDGLRALVESLADSDPRAINSFDLGEGITLRTGKYGPYLEIGSGEERRIVNIPIGLTPDQLTTEKAVELANAPEIKDRVLGPDPDTGFDIVVKNGRYGPYVAIMDEGAPKPKTASLFKSMSPETVSYEEALKLLALPREVGIDPETQTMITAQNGKFGPYLKRGADSRSLEREEQILEITLDEALEIYKQPKTRGRRTAATPLKEFGEDPASKLNVVAKTGQFGPYVSDGVINATIPKEETIEELSPDRAFELLAIRREKLGVEPGQAAPKTSKKKKR